MSSEGARISNNEDVVHSHILIYIWQISCLISLFNVMLVVMYCKIMTNFLFFIYLPKTQIQCLISVTLYWTNLQYYWKIINKWKVCSHAGLLISPLLLGFCNRLYHSANDIPLKTYRNGFVVFYSYSSFKLQTERNNFMSSRV